MKFAQLIFALVAVFAAVVISAPVDVPVDSAVSQDSENDNAKWQRLGSLLHYLIAMPKNKGNHFGNKEFTTLFPSEVEKYNQWYSRYTREHNGKPTRPTRPTRPTASATSSEEVTLVSATPVEPTPVESVTPPPVVSSSSSQEEVLPAIPAPEVPVSDTYVANPDQAYTTYATDELLTMVFTSA
ncbi:hypothetical protein FB645_000914 [Coemansia sp. IMI 203386]|nr:hypothetical protein FB645_000914 [Coemansia sp. IMI 203386]